jgi:hypothetical protein
MRTFDLGDPGACGGADNQDCLQGDFATYMVDTDGIIAEIVSLRSPPEALIRMQDTWQIKVKETRASGSFEMFSGISSQQVGVVCSSLRLGDGSTPRSLR